MYTINQAFGCRSSISKGFGYRDYAFVCIKYTYNHSGLTIVTTVTFHNGYNSTCHYSDINEPLIEYNWLIKCGWETWTPMTIEDIECTINAKISTNTDLLIVNVNDNNDDDESY